MIFTRRKVTFYGLGFLLVSLGLYLRSDYTRLEYKSSSPSLRFLVVGDTGVADQTQKQVAAQMEKICQSGIPLSGIVLLGDNFYPSGVQSISDPLWQKALMEPYGGPCLSQVDFYPILGNHDYKGSVRAQIEYGHEVSRWKMPSRFYSVKFGDLIEFFQLDSNTWEVLMPFWGTNFGYIRKDLAESNSKWRIVTSHHPINSGCSDRVEREDRPKTWMMAKLLCPHTDLWLSGHLHSQEYVLDTELCAAPVAIVGSGGAPLQKGKDCDASKTQFNAMQHGFSELLVSEAALIISFYGSQGEQVFRASVSNHRGATKKSGDIH
jgi:tartrate-resistant acid phosphatase type 5